MTKYIQKIPEFSPYNEIYIGTNRFVGLKFLFNISGYVPIIIGNSGEQPLVWLYVKDEMSIIPVVEKNNELFPIVRVSNNEDKKCISCSIYSNNEKKWFVLINVKYDSDVVVNELDFRPIGLNIYIENESVLHVGNGIYNGNSIEGCETFIYVDEK